MKKHEAAVAGIHGLVEAGEAFTRASSAAPPAEEKRTAGGASDVAQRALRDRRFHTGMAIAFLVTALVGFGPTYYLKGPTEAPSFGLLVHVHAAVFTGWLVLLLVQTALVAARRVKLHQRLGIFGALLALAMVPLGIATSIAAARRGFTTIGNDASALLVFQVGAVVLFAGFVALALWRRRRPELHRRLILLATVCIIPPAIARLPFVGPRPLLALLLSTLFVVAGIVFDLRSRGKVHPVYLWGGLCVVLSAPLRYALGQTSAWQSFARFLVE